MNPELTIRMISLVDSLSKKTTLTGPEVQVYLRGLSFVEKQFQLWNLALEHGIDELDRDPTSFNGEDIEPSINT